MTSRRILKGIMRASVRVREGQGLASSLEEQKIFPDLAVEMLEVGESTGALPAMLNSVAEFYEEDVQTALGASMALIEPLILIIMAVFVGGVLISLYLPIFTWECIRKWSGFVGLTHDAKRERPEEMKVWGFKQWRQRTRNRFL